MSGAVSIETPVLRRFADGQLLNLSKLVIESALQPIVELSTGKVFGYETLLRGHDRLGFASPLELLDTAEEAGQLLGLEQMLSARALAKFATVPDFAHATLFINLMVVSFARASRSSTACCSSCDRPKSRHPPSASS